MRYDRRGGPTSATPGAANRVMLTWDTAKTGIPFEWGTINTAQQAALDFGDATSTALRLNYLRGDQSNEINSLGVGLFRARDNILGDIVDSSPTWEGPPTSPYTATWVIGSIEHRDAGELRYAELSAIRGRRTDASKRRLCRLERRIPAWISRGELRHQRQFRRQQHDDAE